MIQRQTGSQSFSPEVEEILEESRQYKFGSILVTLFLEAIEPSTIQIGGSGFNQHNKLFASSHMDPDYTLTLHPIRPEELRLEIGIGRLEEIRVRDWSGNVFHQMLIELQSHAVDNGVWAYGSGQQMKYELTVWLGTSYFPVQSPRARILYTVLQRIEELGGDEVRSEAQNFFWGGSREKPPV